MEEIGSHEVSIHGGMAEGAWLSPSAALDRFEPPAGMALAATTEEKRVRYGFRVANLGFLIKPACSSEVLQQPDIWDLPGSVPWLLGLVNLRSNLVPVFDLRLLLGLPPREAGAAALVLVFDQGEKAVGLEIDDFPQPLADMSPLSSSPLLPAELQAHVRGGYMKDDAVWLDFDHETFFEAAARSGE